MQKFSLSQDFLKQLTVPERNVDDKAQNRTWLHLVDLSIKYLLL